MPKPRRRRQHGLDISKLTQQAFGLHQQGKYLEAEKLYEAVLQARPDCFDALHLFGVLRAQRGQLKLSAELITRALKLQPKSAEAHFNLGLTLSRLHRHAQALDHFDKALAIKPLYPEALHSRANSLAELGRHEEALAGYDKFLGIELDHFDALFKRGNALAELSRHSEALASFDRALTVKPNHVDALYMRGSTLGKISRHTEALLSYGKALALKPDYAEALNNRGNVLQALGRTSKAVESYRKALASKPTLSTASYNLGHALVSLNRFDEAIASYSRTLEIDPGYKYALGALAHSRAHICDWQGLDALQARVVDAVKAEKPACFPFAFLTFSKDPAEQHTCATTYVRDQHPPSTAALWTGERYQHDRIRVAYLSADFHDHATAHLMAGLFERHDRTRFEVMAVSFGPDEKSSMRTRLKAAFERFVDVRQKSDRSVANWLRRAEVNIVVDLKGYTRQARMDILSHRPAPIQVNYLGFPGTMGAEYIDYIVADRIVIPEEHRAHYAEKIVFLPDCYQVNDAGRVIAEHTPARAEVGLPGQGFVFCSFNNSYKITAEMFGVWMRLLHGVDGSVLWLLEANASAMRNLRHEARARGINPGRLVFAPRVKLPDHLARHRLADLFLDTLPYNAHTTASDALWAGLPVLTCLGTTFAGRVASSLLHAVGLPELVTHTMDAYETHALALARNPARLREIKAKLSHNRLTAPLFDTDRFRRHIEAAYTTMWETYQRGAAPRGFAVGDS